MHVDRVLRLARTAGHFAKCPVQSAVIERSFGRRPWYWIGSSQHAGVITEQMGPRINAKHLVAWVLLLKFLDSSRPIVKMRELGGYTRDD